MSRVLAFEWRRAVSLRSTWGFAALGIALAVFISLAPRIFLFTEGSGGADGAASAGASGVTVSLADVMIGTGNPLALVLITTICAQAFGHEYRDGTMRLVLSEFPARTRVFTAKLAVPALFVLGSVLIAQVVALILASTLWNDVTAEQGWVDVAETAGRQLAVALWWGLMVAGVTVLLRNLAAGIVVAVVLAAVLEPLLTALLGSRAPWLVDALPFSAATEWASEPTTRAGAVALVWVVLIAGSAGLLFRTRDA